MRAHAYIDGFNLYHGALKARSGCKWLDLRKLSASLLPPGCQLEVVRYYTARLPDPRRAQRQEVYLRALRGECAPFFYKKGSIRRKTLVLPRADDGTEVTVRLLQEKQFDVNLAIQLVADACDRLVEAALVVTDDSDLEGALRMVREECGLYLIVASPRGHSALARAVGADLSKSVHGLLRRNAEAAPKSGLLSNFRSSWRMCV